MTPTSKHLETQETKTVAFAAVKVSPMFYYKFCFGKVGLSRIWQQNFEGFGLSTISLFMDSIASRGLPIRRLLLGHGFSSEHARLSTAELSDPGVWHGGGSVKSVFFFYCFDFVGR